MNVDFCLAVSLFVDDVLYSFVVLVKTILISPERVRPISSSRNMAEHLQELKFLDVALIGERRLPVADLE